MNINEMVRTYQQKLFEKCREVDNLKLQLNQSRADHQGVVQSYDSHIAELNKSLSMKNLEISIFENGKHENATPVRPELQGQYECEICTSNLSSTDEVYATKCGHVYHKECISMWIKTSKSCPKCRKPAKMKTLIKLFFDIGEPERPQKPDEVLLESMITEKKRQDEIIKAHEQLISNQNTFLKNSMGDIFDLQFEIEKQKEKCMKALTMLENFYNKSLKTLENKGCNVSNFENCTASHLSENSFEKLLNNSKKLLTEFQDVLENNKKTDLQRIAGENINNKRSRTDPQCSYNSISETENDENDLMNVVKAFSEELKGNKIDLEQFNLMMEVEAWEDLNL